MSFKSEHQTLSFSDLELSRKNTTNLTLKSLHELARNLDWKPIETALVENYPIGKKKKGPQAYPPLMLFKALLLRNWFCITSDAMLESLINDRFSFKKFIGLPLGNPAPDASTFSRFKRRLTPERYEQALADISAQLSEKNMTLNMGKVEDLRVIRKKQPE